VNPRSAAKLRLAAQIYGISQRDYTRGRAAGVYPGLRELESFGLFTDENLRSEGLPVLPPAAPRRNASRGRDFAGQNRRANERARALGYRSKDDQAKRRRDGNPTPADVAQGGGNFQRLPAGRLWLRLKYESGRDIDRAQALLERVLPTVPAGARVAVLVGFVDGSYRNLTSSAGVPADQLEGGLLEFIADLLAGGGAGMAGGTGAPKDPMTPRLRQWMERLAAKGDEEARRRLAEEDGDAVDDDGPDLLDEVQEIQLTFIPPVAGISDDF
jgi:hypothetical protein